MRKYCQTDARLTRSRDGSTGTKDCDLKSNILRCKSTAKEEITGMYLIDEEGTLRNP
jgi:hypothetical protein